MTITILYTDAESVHGFRNKTPKLINPKKLNFTLNKIKKEAMRSNHERADRKPWSSSSGWTV